MANVATVPTWASSLRESRAVAAGFALVGALPVLLFAYPPGTDFPHHEAVDALLAHPSRFHHLYTLNPGQPNQLFAAWTALVTALTSPLGASPDVAFRLALVAVIAWLSMTSKRRASTDENSRF